MTNFLFSFAQTSNLETVGSKSLNLMRLTQAGMLVPAGFVISTTSYMDFVKFNRLNERISSALQALKQGQALAEISAMIRVHN